MHTFKSLLALGVAIMTLVEAQGHRSESKVETTLGTVHIEIPHPQTIVINHPEPENTPTIVIDRSYPPRSPANLKNQDLPVRVPEQIEPNPIRGAQAPPAHDDINPSTSSNNITHPPIPLPNGPANPPKPNPNPLPNGPSPTHTPITFPQGPTPLPPTIISNGPAFHPHNLTTLTSSPSTYTLSCIGSNLNTKTRTCFSNSNTDLTGYWCGANCKCNSAGIVSCDAKRAPGCSEEVLSATCSGVVRDWKCSCVRSVEGEGEEE